MESPQPLDCDYPLEYAVPMSKSTDRQKSKEDWRNRPRIPASRRKDQRFAFRLNEATAEKLRLLAEENDLTVSEFVVEAIEQHISRLEKRHPPKKS